MSELEKLPGSTACVQIPAQLHPAFPHGAALGLPAAFPSTLQKHSLPHQAWPSTVENTWNNTRSQHLRFMRQRTDAQGKETLRSSLCSAMANHSDLPKLGFEAWLCQEAVGGWDHHTRYQSASCSQCLFCFIQRGRRVQLRSGQTGLSWRLWGSVLATGHPCSTWAETFLKGQPNV